MIDNEKEFLSVKEVSQILRIPLRTIYRLANQGRIRSIRIGGRLRCYREDIEKCSIFGTGIFGVGIPDKPSERRNERRIHPRINSNFTCQYFVNLAPYKNISGTGIIKNIGAGGVFLNTECEDMVCKNIAEDDPVEIQFDLELMNITAKGRIIRKGESGVAVKFRGLDKETENKIIYYIG